MSQNVKTKRKLANKLAPVAATAAVVFLPAMANAAELDFTAATGELAGVQTAVLGLIGVLLTIFGIVLGWRTFRRSAN